MTFEEIDRNLDAIARQAYVCPRCGGAIPTIDNPGAYPGALSRVADVEICSACGTHEAMQPFMFGKATTPRREWPITGKDLDDLRTCEDMNRQAREASEQLRNRP